MNILTDILNKLFPNRWERIDYLPKWIKLHDRYICDGCNCRIYVKGKTFIYKIDVYNWKGGNQTEKVWRKLRHK